MNFSGHALPSDSFSTVRTFPDTARSLVPFFSIRADGFCSSDAMTWPTSYIPARSDYSAESEGDETFLECVVREVHEETGYLAPPERFEHLAATLVLT